MIEAIIKLDKIGDAQTFATLAKEIMGDVTLCSGRYIVDGKSILGIYSLNLSDTIKMEIEGDVPHHIKEKMKQFIV
jgi:phosphotransferase system HPr-like phosphotransfer protein